MDDQSLTGITATVDPSDERRLVCEAPPGKALEITYVRADGQRCTLPPCTHFEIRHIDMDGVSIVPDMLDPAP